MNHPILLDTENVLYAAVVTDVQNMTDVVQRIRTGKLDACFLKGHVLPDIFITALAARHALASQLSGSMITKTIQTEILYSLYPGRKV